jgi:hypothetical protein
MRFRTWFVFLFLAGCGKSCGTGERVHVIYRGPAQLTEKGVVTRNQVALGYVESVQKSTGIQRATLHLRLAGELHRGDRFIPETAKGLTGFQVIAGRGDVLHDGDEVEADSSFQKRAYYAEMGQNSPGGITLPSGVYVPYPAGLTREAQNPRHSAEVKYKREITKRLEVPADPDLKISPALATRYKELQTKLLDAGPADGLQILNTEGAALSEALKQESIAARVKKDRPTEQATRRMAERIGQMQKKLTRDVAREQRKGPRKVREGFVPPDLQ